MIINYSINKSKYKATFCHDKESPDIDKALSKLYCDKKMLLIIDKKLNKNLNIFLNEFNSKNENIFNKISFRNFVKSFFNNYYEG